MLRPLVAEMDASEPIRLAAALRAGKKVAPDVTQLLADDHRTVLGWLRWCSETSDTASRSVLLRQICLALRAHMAAEEEYLYPAVERSDSDGKIVSRAVQEHARAKQLIERLERGSAKPAASQPLVAELQAEIATHVAEEETELFPAARRAGIDLYELGGLVAARRVSTLLALRGSPGSRNLDELKEEIPTMQIAQDEAREYFLLGLRNAHATTRQGRVLVEGQLQRLESYPALKAKLAEHLREKDEQLARLEQLLSSHGESPSVVKGTAMAMAAGAAAIASAAAADEIVKTSFAMLAQAKYEAAAFETLLVFAEAAGETGALRPLQQCLSESRGLASFLEENLRGTAVRFLQLRSERRQAKR